MLFDRPGPRIINGEVSVIDKILSPEEEELAKLEQDIELCRVRYDQYFTGLEKIPPELLRSRINKAIIKSKLGSARRAALRFRFMRLVQKFRTYESMWDRIMREIESGKRRRERFLHAEGGPVLTRKELEITKRLEEDTRAKDTDLERLYREFVEARRKVGKDTTIDLPAFSNKVEALRKTYRDLKVEIRGQRVVIVGKKKGDKKGS